VDDTSRKPGSNLQGEKNVRKKIFMKNNNRMHRFSLWLSAALCAGALMVAVVGQAAPSASVSTSTSTKAAKVDVNNADVTTLQTLPGVGPAIAQKIVDNRPYKSYADLEKVSGLSKAKVDAMKGQVTFGATTAAKSGAKSSKTVTSTTTSPSSKSVTTTTSKPTASEKSTVTRTESTSSKPLTATGKVNINTASQEELDVLPGIGPTRAKAIIDYRAEHGNFKSIDEIKNVKGIKEGEFSKIQDKITTR
jgi:competence protein ComEA